MAMSEQPQPVAGAAASTTKARTSFGILGAISLSHLLNDMIQSLILAIYPLLQSEFSLTFMQIGMITLTFQLASSLLQPVVGYWTDKYPMPWSLPIGMCFTLSGLVLLALAGSFGAVLLAAALVGTGSSVFHPESSRVARMASGGRHLSLIHISEPTRQAEISYAVFCLKKKKTKRKEKEKKTYRK